MWGLDILNAGLSKLNNTQILHDKQFADNTNYLLTGKKQQIRSTNCCIKCKPNVYTWPIVTG